MLFMKLALITLPFNYHYVYQNPLNYFSCVSFFLMRLQDPQGRDNFLEQLCTSNTYQYLTHSWCQTNVEQNWTTNIVPWFSILRFSEPWTRSVKLCRALGKFFSYLFLGAIQCDMVISLVKLNVYDHVKRINYKIAIF